MATVAKKPYSLSMVPAPCGTMVKQKNLGSHAKKCNRKPCLGMREAQQQVAKNEAIKRAQQHDERMKQQVPRRSRKDRVRG